MRKWSAELGAIGATIILAYHLDLSLLMAFLLWTALDLMTASRKQMDGET